ncbi:MAG: 4-(cytidine 5'-diphospho)-2-C-methyl-D-erythritol kinase [Pirellulales bacterium]
MVRAPAKLNLFFEVLAKRSDGFHEIETLMVPIGLFDTLVASPDPSGRISVACRWAAPGDGASLDAAYGALPRDEQSNLAYKAAQLLQARSGSSLGLHLDLVKRIPTAAGLGGGSSDAAATLLAANELWRLGWRREQLTELAAELGSDVPFFLHQGPAICRGRGERVEALRGLGALDIVLVRPPASLSTPAVYGRCRPAAAPRALAPLVSALQHGDVRQLPALLHNRLEEAAETLTPWVSRLRSELVREDCLAAQLSGSGSAYFGICRHARHAQRVARRLQARGVGQVYALRTCH